MLYLVGLGLSPSHLTEMARRILSNSDVIYLDVYTNVLREEDISTYEAMVGRSFVRADRYMLEDNMKDIIQEAKSKNVAVAVSGDPLVATTHIALYAEALKEGVAVEYLPGVSIHTVAMSLSGLQHYKFGPVVTVPNHYRSSPSFYDKIHKNLVSGNHTLVLLDLHPEPITIPTALEAILYWEKKRRKRVLEYGDLVVGIARAGSGDCYRFVGTVEELMEVYWGDPPHTLVIPGELHPLEEETLYLMRRHKNGRCSGES